MSQDTKQLNKRLIPLESVRADLVAEIERIRQVTAEDVQLLRKDFYDVKVSYVDAAHSATVDKEKLRKEIKGVQSQNYQ